RLGRANWRAVGLPEPADPDAGRWMLTLAAIPRLAAAGVVELGGCYGDRLSLRPTGAAWPPADGDMARGRRSEVAPAATSGAVGLAMAHHPAAPADLGRLVAADRDLGA